MLINRAYRLMLVENIISAHSYSGINNAWRIWIGAVLLVGVGFSPVVIAAVSLAATIATIVTAPWAGAFVERMDKWRVSIVAELVDGIAFAVAAAVLLFSDDIGWRISVTVIAATAIIKAVAESFNDAAGMVIYRSVVPEEQFGKGVGYLQAASASGNSLGPALGATILTASNIVVVYLLNLVVSIVNVFLISGMRRVSGVRLPGTGHTSRRDDDRRVSGDIRESLRTVMGDRRIRDVFVLEVIVSGSMAMFVTVELFFILENLAADPWWYGVAVGLFGAGTFAGSLVAAAVTDRFDLGATVWGFLLVAAASILVLSRMTDLAWALPFNVLFGVSMGCLNAALTPMLLRLTPQTATARVSSLFSTVTRTSALLAMAVASGLAGTVLVDLDIELWSMRIQRIDVIFTGAGLGLFVAALWAKRSLLGVHGEADRRRTNSDAATLCRVRSDRSIRAVDDP